MANYLLGALHKLSTHLVVSSRLPKTSELGMELLKIWIVKELDSEKKFFGMQFTKEPGGPGIVGSVQISHINWTLRHIQCTPYSIPIVDILAHNRRVGPVNIQGGTGHPTP